MEVILPSQAVDLGRKIQEASKGRAKGEFDNPPAFTSFHSLWSIAGLAWQQASDLDPKPVGPYHCNGLPFRPAKFEKIFKVRVMLELIPEPVRVVMCRPSILSSHSNLRLVSRVKLHQED
jgi:hypothetical protein